MEQNNQAFSYSYSAKEQEEIRRIRDKYIEKKDTEEDKMEKLRRLDRRVLQKAQAISLIFGVIGALLLGFGMSLIMTDLASGWGLSQGALIAIGIVLGVIGMALAALAYPAYLQVMKKEREKVAPEIIRLSDELMK